MTRQKQGNKIEKEIIERVLKEDIGSGDITTEAVVPPDLVMRGAFTAKEAGVAAGLDLAAQVFFSLDDGVRFIPLVEEGEEVTCGTIMARVEGPARALLSGERTSLNILQRMSGIATETRRYVRALEGTGTILLDTRKTAPGLRIMDKRAVRAGGGSNHRFGLFDMVLIKENHAAAAGSLDEAVRRARKNLDPEIMVEVEVRNLAELEEVVNLPVDRILLDNMTLQDIRRAVQLVQGKIPLEASGNMTPERASGAALAGVDYVSAGSVTHSVKGLDISLLLSIKEAQDENQE